MPIKDPQRRKEYQREYGRKWYLKNRDKVIASNKKNKRKRQLKGLEYKSTFSCSECGIKHPALIDFHHKDGETKETELSTFVNQDGSCRQLLIYPKHPFLNVVSFHP